MIAFLKEKYYRIKCDLFIFYCKVWYFVHVKRYKEDAMKGEYGRILGINFIETE